MVQGDVGEVAVSTGRVGDRDHPRIEVAPEFVEQRAKRRIVRPFRRSPTRAVGLTHILHIRVDRVECFVVASQA